MTINDLIDLVRSFGGVLVQQPQPGDGTPEIAHGDVFFYYAPDGVAPQGQPFATIITKNYPGDERSRLDRPGAFRVNVGAAASEARQWPDEPADDVVFRHPLYGRAGWLCVTNPGPNTATSVAGLLRSAHGRARARV